VELERATLELLRERGVLAGLNTRRHGSNRGEPRAGLGPAAGRHPAVVRVSGAAAPLPDGDSCSRSWGLTDRPFRLLRNLGHQLSALAGDQGGGRARPETSTPRWHLSPYLPWRSAARCSARSSPASCGLNPTTSTTGSPRSLLSCSMPSVRVRTGQPRRRGVVERDNWRRHQPKPARLRLRADRGLRAAPLLAGPDRLEHARIQQRRRVAELTTFGDVTQQPAHDLSAAGLGHLWDHVDLPRTSDR
jgi:hypothetical protein